MTDPHAYTRRTFLRQGLTLASAMTTVPYFLQQSAFGLTRPEGSPISSQPGVPEDRVLVVVQLGGGNDGLNTVVPHGSPLYYNHRPGLAVRAPRPGAGVQPGACLPLDESAGIGLHPSMAPFKELLDEGVASIVQGVGYPNPNRSHFASMDIWHTADRDGRGHGWLGRYFDNECNGTPIPQGSVSIGREAPLALEGEVQKPVNFESAELFRWLGKDLHHSLEKPYESINRSGELPDIEPGSQMSYLMRTALDAQVASDKIRAAVAQRPLVPYPGTNLARQLQMVGAMIRAELSTRVYYVSQGGFDTHAGQAGPHANLLGQVAGALNAFHRDLQKQGNSKRVLTMVFSEFGRRVRQNASGGTDHGTAAPMYFVGDMVRPGLLGTHPSLEDLDGGDLRFTVDFRSVYAGVLEDWMKSPSEPVLGGSFAKAPILNVRP